MKKLNPIFNHTLHLNESFDFIFESVELGVLIENANREVEFVNKLFCELFQIRSKPVDLLKSNTISNARGFSMKFENAAQFENSIKDLSIAAVAVRREQWKLRDGRIILRDYFPIFNGNNLKGHIWIYKEQKNIESIIDFKNDVSIIENALHHLPGEIAIYNTKSEFVFINKAYIKSNEKRLWAIGKTIAQYYSYANLSGQTALYRQENINKTIQTKEAVSWEELNITPQKNKQYFLRTCHPVLDNYGQVESVIEQSIDISAQRKLEQDLKIATNNFFTTLDNVNDIVLQTDSELKLKFINKAWENTTGNQFDDYKGKPIFDVLSVTRYEMYNKMFAILSGSVTESKGVIAVNGKDGKEKQLQYNLRPTFSVEENKTGILATLTDITHLKQQETQLLELVKREKELNELKTAFVNMVSHELRTPLTVISSSAEILDLMLQAGKSHQDVAIYTKQIIDEVEKMTAFMQDLLMVSKIEAGKIEINTKPTNIVTFVSTIIKNGFNPWKDGRNTILEIKRNALIAQIDENMLQHALQNLLQNAFKYSAGKNDVKVRIAFATTYYTISVIDNGIGIPQAEKEKMFTSFFRASNTGNISGTGIGLIVTKYFTEQHKGYVAVKSSINKGSIFTLKLPYNTK